MSDKTAVVLAGGGSLGAVPVGMLQALMEARVATDLVRAAVGAINGATPNRLGGTSLRRGVEDTGFVGISLHASYRQSTGHQWGLA